MTKTLIATTFMFMKEKLYSTKRHDCGATQVENDPTFL